MLPTKLGMASLRQTSRLRKNTGHQRLDKSGKRQMLRFCDCVMAGVFMHLPEFVGL